MSRPTDWSQRELARDPAQSYIVQAPAGSGKTELLSQRMLGLLATVENPEEVIAITFTRKAAAEMRHRLLSHLQEAVSSEKPIESLQEHEQISRRLALKVLNRSATQNWNLLEQPNRMRIRTIDGLCSELSRQLPILSGLGGNQQIAVDSEALYRQAATRTLAAIETQGDSLKADVVRILDRYDNQYDRLVDLLTSMLSNREQWLPHIFAAQLDDDSFDRQSLEDALRFLVESQLETIRAEIPSDLLDNLPQFFNYALANQPADAIALNALLVACGGVDSSSLNLPTKAEDLSHWRTLINRLLTTTGSWRKSVDAKAGFPAPSAVKGEAAEQRKFWKTGFAALLEEQRSNNKLAEQLSLILSLPQPDYSDADWASLESLMRILIRASLEWKVLMAESGELDFSEVVARAIQSLGHSDAPSDLALRLDYRIQHLLVDEFQDTSAIQIRLLDQLTSGWTQGDGRTLFLVGDPMQSIYRFRKAEVSLFIQAWQGKLFEHLQLQALQLSVNFRSTEPIVSWVNQIFPEVMPAVDDPVNGAVHYSKADTRPDVASNGEVIYKILPERDDIAEAQLVTEIIRKSPESESIAILVRSRNHATEILAALDRLKIDEPRFRYQALEFTRLNNTPLIQDLLSLTLALNQPADRLAWLACLRTAFVGLDLADLDELVDADSSSTIIDCLSLRQEHLSVDAQQRLRRVLPVLQQAMDHRGKRPIRQLIETTWTRLGGPTCINNSSELEDAAAYFALLTAMENDGISIDRETINKRMEKLFAQPDSQANGNLLITTIYSAKGLQFDRVILPGLNKKTSGDPNKLLHWFELTDTTNQLNGIVLSPMRNTEDKEKNKSAGDLIEFIANIEKQRQSLEGGRLLYVAATRAIHSLYLLAAVKPDAKDVIKADNYSLLGRLWPAIASQQIPIIHAAFADLNQARENQSTQDDPAEKQKLPQFYRRHRPDWKIPAAATSIKTEKPEMLESSDYLEFNWAGQDARRTGELVHRLLQQIGEHGISHWKHSNGFKNREHWCRQQLASEGVLNNQADKIISRTEKAIDNCLSSKTGQWLLDAHDSAACEYAITAVISAKAKRMVLDRTFIENGTRWIIDYKTSSHSGGDLDIFLASEAKRYKQQLQNYKDAIAINENLPIKAALYFPLMDEFKEIALN